MCKTSKLKNTKYCQVNKRRFNNEEIYNFHGNERLNIIYMSVLPNLIFRFNVIPADLGDGMELYC